MHILHIMAEVCIFDSFPQTQVWKYVVGSKYIVMNHSFQREIWKRNNSPERRENSREC